jgi:hypothetical protein
MHAASVNDLHGFVDSRPPATCGGRAPEEGSESPEAEWIDLMVTVSACFLCVNVEEFAAGS